MQNIIKQKNSLFNAFVPNDATAGGGDDELSAFNNDDAVYMFNNSVIYIFFLLSVSHDANRNHIASLPSHTVSDNFVSST